MIDLTRKCPTCGKRADMCFTHGEIWKRRQRENTSSELQMMRDDELRAAVNEFTEDDPPPYGGEKSMIVPFRNRIGRRVHGWRWPIVWFARRKPRSNFRQWLWMQADALDWRFRVKPELSRMVRGRKKTGA